MPAIHDYVYYTCIILCIIEINKQNPRSYLELALRSTNTTSQFKRDKQKSLKSSLTGNKSPKALTEEISFPSEVYVSTLRKKKQKAN